MHLITKLYSIRSIRIIWVGKWHVWERGEVHTGFLWWGRKPEEKIHLKDTGVNGRRMLNGS
jgi:hypothetical protein